MAAPIANRADSVMIVDDDDDAPEIEIVASTSKYLFDLCDDMLIEILQFVHAANDSEARLMCELATVSRRFYKITHHRALWLKCTFDTRNTSLTKMYQMLRLPQYAPHIRTLKIVSDRMSSTSSPCRPSGSRTVIEQRRGSGQQISRPFMQKLRSTCPRLIELHLVSCDLLEMGLLSAWLADTTIRVLRMPQCQLHFDAFVNDADTHADDPSLPPVIPPIVHPLAEQLTVLDLSNCHNLSSRSRSLRGLLGFRHMTHLNIERCCQISNMDLCSIPQCMPMLHTLIVADVSEINNAFLLAVGKYSSCLVNLDLSFTSINSAGIAQMCQPKHNTAGVCMPSLRHINLTATMVDDSALDALAAHSAVTSIKLMKSNCSKERVERFEGEKQSCDVTFNESEFGKTNPPVQYVANAFHQAAQNLIIVEQQAG